LWFFDESGVNLSFARLYGRSNKGERVVGHVPKNWGDSTTMLAGIGTRGLLAPMLLRGSLTAEVFSEYLEGQVVPSLREGDIVVIDNLAAHKAARVADAIKAAKASFLYLPPYSPDFNPIELAWSKIKTLIRGRAPRTMDQLVEAVAIALRAITADDIHNWIRHCGYAITA
jgi:transposase